jgi:hypothetical protein
MVFATLPNYALLHIASQKLSVFKLTALRSAVWESAENGSQHDGPRGAGIKHTSLHTKMVQGDLLQNKCPL